MAPANRPPKPTPRTWAAGAATALLLAAAPARADVVRMPEKPCPPGSAAETDHCGPWCRPWPCSSDADCARTPRGRDAGLHECRQMGVCVETQKYESCSGWSHGQPRERQVVHGECSSDSDCDSNKAKCVVAKHCAAAAAPPTGVASSSSDGSTTSHPTPAPPTSPTASPPSSRCGCTLVGSESAPTPLSLLWLASIGITTARRRRSRQLGRGTAAG
jgi:hypothetical protein